jgi:Second Messenger Oligonucleotide or Dinucleotide Synthetase domain
MRKDRLSEHLKNLCRELRLPHDDLEDIRFIHQDLKQKVAAHFTKVEDHFLFGSLSTNSLLPLEIDPTGDIDYLVVFRGVRNSSPAQYLEKLHSFCKLKLRGYIAQPNHPAILASGRAINIDLVPGVQFESGALHIPKSSSSWVESDPLSNAHFYKDSEGSMTRCLRILKYLNVRSGKLIPPFHIRDFLVEQRFSMNRENSRPGTFTEEMKRIIALYSRRYGISGGHILVPDRHGQFGVPDDVVFNLLPLPSIGYKTLLSPKR